MRKLLLIALVSLTACSPGPAAKPVATPERAAPIVPIPSDLAPGVERALRVGHLIYDQDQYASRATDVALESGAVKEGIGILGWVVTHERDAVVVTFVREEGDKIRPHCHVDFGQGFGRPELRMAEAHEKLVGDAAAMFKARQTAMDASIEACSERYNPVVLPASVLGKTGWLVYLIPGTTTPDLVLVGGYFRVHVSPDGASILAVTPMYGQCFEMQAPRDAVPYFTDHTNSAPVETQVFLSLLHNKPILIATERGLWQVSGDKVLYVNREDARRQSADPS